MSDEDDVFLVEESVPADGDVLLPGWYFYDEASAPHGPYDTRKEAAQARKDYSNEVLGP